MDSSMLQAFSGATGVAKAVLALLVLMSVASWAVMYGKWRSLVAARRGVSRLTDQVLEASSLAEAAETIDVLAGPSLKRMTSLGFKEFTRLSLSGDAEKLVADNVRRILRHGIAEEIRVLSRALPFLAIAANSAPFIGLFGTVWGIMHSFHAIGQMKSASLATVAPGISEALIATAVGLAVAIPASVAYNIFLGMIESLESQYISFAGLLLNRLRHDACTYPQGMELPPLRKQVCS
ncbi:MAG TPA: MotA/TolQ/ExbB proton channel family protein [Solidesulfovibrio magneticus]|nr:MotA/TolQ/ExbB proton channel family protein [Solidesulfovibrio magneticus]